MKIDEKELISNYFAQALQETKKLIAIPSFLTKATSDAPYGQATKKALDYVIDLAKRLGFDTYQDPQNRYGYLDYGTGEKTFAILCHLDVVPPGNLDKWITDPFEAIEQDNKLIGRGAFDDKGPTMMNLYALKYLKDKGFKSEKYKIRMIFGLTEETTWQSIKAYIADHGNADAGYVPDGEFPVVYAEKWIVNLDIKSTAKTEIEITGGVAYNVICDTVVYKGPKIKEIQKYLTEHEINNSLVKNKLIVYGKAGHASLPWLGINAATFLAKAMYENQVHHPITDFIAKDMHLDFALSNVFGDISDETGELTQNIGKIEIKDQKATLGVNYRVPVFTEPKQIFIPTLNDYLEKLNLTTEVVSIEDSVYVPKDSELIKKIMKVYQEVTGDLEAKPLAIGGGTYAKAMPNIVAFGAEFDIEESTMHAYNEYVRIDDLKKMLEIYAKAIVLLTE
ncbi:M20 family metallopeptidase [Mycoplasma putrefaciens]|uniref:Xaa-His dipeptidase n=1 Tax=Mycoplasma putrefaciens Mput9231 TaxID=1292033 RepID=M9WHL3_9MOLU|nr:M20 family metallopeptidase [Mycoplasma putrefaciens]AGJ90869.1 Xaa-His dipeptidase [Mycoplasma putrefaciens Mput9231]